MERELALLAKPVLLKTPMTGHNASHHKPSPHPEPHAPTEASSTVLLAVFVLRPAKHVPDRHRMTVFSVLLAPTSSAEAALALTETAFAPVLTSLLTITRENVIVCRLIRFLIYGNPNLTPSTSILGCPSKCTGCKIPSFNVASTADQLQCTGCIPGFVLSQGKCVGSCPSGTFLDPTHNTCNACDSSCSTCAGSATFCLTCANSKLASSGSCVASCPSNTFSSPSTCVACHPDCATCSGAAFNQCSSCPPNQPVLTNGRCLPTCAQNQFFDKTTSTCQACDSSCSSCSGSGSSSCLACGNSNQVLRSGSCVSASCNGSTTVIPGLGVCLSELVVVPQPSGTATVPPLPTITGINTPAPPKVDSTNRLQWWQILLMTLGCAFIFLVILLCWRRRARKQRANKTKQFAIAKRLDDPKGWRQRLVRFGERLFGHTPKNSLDGNRLYTTDPPPGYHEDPKKGDIMLRDLEAQRRFREAPPRPTTHHEDDLDGIVGAYEYQQSLRSSPSEYSHYYRQQPHNDTSAELRREYSRLQQPKPREDILDSIASRSIYSQVTGSKRRAPEPRLPVRDFPGSRFSTSTGSGSSHQSRPLTPAEEYKSSVQQRVQQNLTGASNQSSGSNNPFRKYNS